MDPAAHVVVARGSPCIVEVARDGEQLQSRVTIDLYVMPASFKEGVDLGRVALSSRVRSSSVPGPMSGRSGRRSFPRLRPRLAHLSARITRNHNRFAFGLRRCLFGAGIDQAPN